MSSSGIPSSRAHAGGIPGRLPASYRQRRRTVRCTRRARRTPGREGRHRQPDREKWLESNPDGILQNGRILSIGRQVRTDRGGFIDLVGVDRDGPGAIPRRYPGVSEDGNQTEALFGSGGARQVSLGPAQATGRSRSRRRRDLHQVRKLGDRAAEHPALDAETGPLAWDRPGRFDTIHGPIAHGNARGDAAPSPFRPAEPGLTDELWGSHRTLR